MTTLTNLMKFLLLFAISFSFTNAFSGCNTSKKTSGCTASYYHDKFHGRRTASGEIFDQGAYTCASNVYKMGTILKLTNPKTKKTIFVRVNDTGKLYGRTLDLSKKAFMELDDLKKGIIMIEIEEVILQPF